MALGDIAYQAYLQLVGRTRKELVKSTGLGVEEPVKQNKETQEYYAKVQALSAASAGMSVGQRIVSDKGNEKYYEKVDKRREDTLAQSEIVVDGALEEPTSEFPFAKKDPIYQDPSFPEAKRQEKAIEDGKDVEKYFRERNENNFSNAALDGFKKFPEPGQDVEGHDTNMGPLLSDATTYEVPATPNKPASKNYKSWVSVPKHVINQQGTPSQPLDERLNELLEQQRKATPGSYKFFIEKLHGKKSDGNFFKKGPIKSGLTPIDLPNRMVFPAYISAFNDGYDLSWSDYKFIGRGEKVSVWDETTRSLTLEFYMMSDFSSELLLAAGEVARKAAQGKQTNTTSSADTGRTANTPTAETDAMSEIKRLFPDWGEGTTQNSVYGKNDREGFVAGQISGTPEMLYERMTFLAQCCYGWYRKDGKLKEQPFIRVRIGDFLDVICRINSMQFTEDEFDMDLNPSTIGAIPMAVKVAMNMTIIHEDEPTSEYRRFYHRKDYDNEADDFIPDSSKNTSIFKDSTLDNYDTHSPAVNRDTLSTYGEGVMDFPKKVSAFQEGLKSYTNSAAGLVDSANKLNDFVKNEKLKRAIDAAKKLLNISKELDLNVITPVKEYQAKPSASAVTAAIPKTAAIPEKSKAIFPQFKTPNV